ncbi:MAG: hypothetical protein CVV52_04010 [Spirochaetae bacterium HGW-Spirochaetae-8]|jgi:hypothetical protein|nr:MAG: hypothetical protein CVV52_04010 [Spirochaetae bacterium HGW-Spirochaetae-8]
MNILKIFSWLKLNSKRLAIGAFILMGGALGIKSARLEKSKAKVKEHEKVIQNQEVLKAKQLEINKAQDFIVEKVLDKQNEVRKKEIVNDQKIVDAKNIEGGLETQFRLADDMFADWNNRVREQTPKH